MRPVASKLSSSKSYLGNISLLLLLFVCLFACFFSLKIFTNTSAVLRDCEMSTLTYIKSYFCGLIFVINIIFYCAHTDESIKGNDTGRRLI